MRRLCAFTMAALLMSVSLTAANAADSPQPEPQMGFVPMQYPSLLEDKHQLHGFLTTTREHRYRKAGWASENERYEKYMNGKGSQFAAYKTLHDQSLEIADKVTKAEKELIELRDYYRRLMSTSNPVAIQEAWKKCDDKLKEIEGYYEQLDKLHEQMTAEAKKASDEAGGKGPAQSLLSYNTLLEGKYKHMRSFLKSETWIATDAPVRVGGEGTGTRRLTGLAAGRDDTDAVNVAQLRQGLTHYVSIKDYNGGIEQPNYNNDGARAWGAIAIGPFAKTTEDAVNSIIIGSGNNQIVEGEYSIVIGYNSIVKDRYQTFEATEESEAGTYPEQTSGSIAIGRNAEVYSSMSIALGDRAVVGEDKDLSETGEQYYSTAIGTEAHSIGYGTTTLGAKAEATATYAAALGVEAKATGAYSSALGYGAKASGRLSSALGWSAEASGYHSMALGIAAKASQTQAVALGSSAKATREQAVALGSSSVANRKEDWAGYDPSTGDSYEKNEEASALWREMLSLSQAASQEKDKTRQKQLLDQFNAKQKEYNQLVKGRFSTLAAAAVGDEAQGFTRQITGVSAGTRDTDAVNVAQLKGLVSRVQKLEQGGTGTSGSSTWKVKAGAVTETVGGKTDTLTVAAGNNATVALKDRVLTVGVVTNPTFETVTMADKNGSTVYGREGVTKKDAKGARKAEYKFSDDGVITIHVPGKGGADDISRVLTDKSKEYKDLLDKVNKGGAVATGGWTLKAAGETALVNGDHALAVSTDDNIKATLKADANGENTLSLKLADDLKVKGSVTVGEKGPKLSKDGLDMKGKAVTGAADAMTDDGLVTLRQVKSLVGSGSGVGAGVIDDLKRDLKTGLAEAHRYSDAGDAAQSALGALQPLDYDEAHPTSFAFGMGGAGGQTAFALGLTHYFSADRAVNVGASLAGEMLHWRVGVAWRVGDGEKTVSTSTANVAALQRELAETKRELEALKEEVRGLKK